MERRFFPVRVERGGMPRPSDIKPPEQELYGYETQSVEQLSERVAEHSLSSVLYRIVTLRELSNMYKHRSPMVGSGYEINV